MHIILYNVTKKENSTYIPNDSVTHTDVEVLLKTPTSKHNPSFDLNTDPTPYNYVKWDSKYYWITETTYVRNGYWRIDCEEDVLGSFKPEIIEQCYYITRSEQNPDPLLIDDLYPKRYPVTTDRTVSEIPYDTNGTYVIGLKSKKGVKYYALSRSSFNDLCAKIFAESQDTLWDSIVDATTTISKSFLNVMDYVVSCHWLPFKIAEGVGTMESMSFGYWDSGIDGQLVTGNVYYVVGKVSIPTNTTYTGSNSFTQYILHIPSIGDFPMDASILSTYTELNIVMSIDVIGNVLGRVFCEAGKGNILHFTGTTGAEIQLSANTMSLGGIMGAIATTASFIGGVKGKSASQIIAGGASGIASADLLVPTTQTVGGQGSFAQPEFDKNIELIRYTMSQCETRHSIYGRPCMKYVKLSAGYNEIERPLITFGDIWEKRRIIQFMQNGFYYE